MDDSNDERPHREVAQGGERDAFTVSEKWRQLLARNELFFDTVAAVLLSVMALVVSTAQLRTSRAQVELAKAQLDVSRASLMPQLELVSRIRMPAGESVSTEDELTISNHGGPVEGFDSLTAVYLGVKCQTTSKSTRGQRDCLVSLPLTGY